MTSSSTAKFWFLLLDSATGQPYKGTTADFVSLPPGAVVAEFRDAVLSKNPAILTGIAPSQLIVYRNIAAFDRRNNDAANKEEKEEPLDPTQSVNGLGSQEDMLVVAVPPPPSQPSLQQIQPLLFPPCKVSFFNNLDNATESHGGWISFGHEVMPSTSLNSLYIRECYRTIAECILEGNGSRKGIITGTPGICKLLLLIYLLWKLVREGERVLLIYGIFNIYYDGNGGVFQFDSGRLPSDIDYSFWNDTLWCLFDAKGKCEADLYRLPVELCTFIVSTSPRRDLVNDFKKPPEPQIFYMPIWTKAELEMIAPLFPNAIEWQNRFEILGGIPRHVLEVTTKNPTAILEEACRKVSLDDCIREVSMESDINNNSTIIHSLIHITSVPPFTESSVRYASPTALNIIFRFKGKDAKRQKLELLESCDGNPLSAALRGHIFEQYAIELLEKGGKFSCRQLFRGSENNKPGDTKINIPPSKKIVADKVLANQTLNQLYVPKSKNYAAIDAWIPGVGAFQITVGKNHGINGRVEEDLAKLGEANRLYWVLPPEHYQSFTKKTPQSIEQYAVMIPYPE